MKNVIKRFETFTSGISEISTYWNKIATDEMKCYGLKSAYAIYLVALYEHPEGITSSELCELCNKDKAEISRAVSLMEKKGLCIREKTTVNSYRALIKLTDKGKKASSGVCERAKIAVEQGGKGLDADERAIFYKALRIISSNLKIISKEGLPR